MSFPSHVQDPQDTYARLCVTITQAREAYYNTGTPIMDDAEFDALIERCEQLEAQYSSVLDTSASPLAKVGASVEIGTRHTIPMLSLAKVTDEKGVRAFIDSLPHGTLVVVQSKLDGVSMSLEYVNGSLRRAVTRGDGTQGEDVTHILSHLPSVPTSLPQPFTGIVRGEVVIHKDELPARFKNARNAVSGLLNYRTKTPTDAAKNNCRFYAFDVYSEEFDHATIGMQALKQLGFVLPEHSSELTSGNVWDAINKVLDGRADLPYDIDGIVVKADSHRVREQLGNRSNSPRWAIAFKAASDTAATTLKNVTWQVGVSGFVTPVAELEPVDLGGVTISRASLHNQLQIQKLGIAINDIVTVKRAGDVIPQVVGSLHTAEDSIQIAAPTECPECSGTLIVEGNSGQLKCVSFECPAQIVGRLSNWAKRDGADIDAIGPVFIELFSSRGLVRSPADFYFLSASDLSRLPRMGEGNVKRFLASIDASRACGMRRAIIGLSINMVGEGTAQRLCKHYESIEELASATYDELLAIEDIGPAVAMSITAAFSSDYYRTQIQRLRDGGVSLDRLPEDGPRAVPSGSGPFAGKRVAITGTLWTGRTEIVRMIESAGAVFDKSVSSKTDILIIADPSSSSSKAKAARDKGVLLMGSSEAQQLLS